MEVYLAIYGGGKRDKEVSNSCLKMIIPCKMGEKTFPIFIKGEKEMPMVSARVTKDLNDLYKLNE